MNNIARSFNKGQLLDATKGQILDYFFDCLPSKPYCTDNLGVLNIRPKASACNYAYIQCNPISRCYWMIFDIDDSDYRNWIYEHSLPMPNIEIFNPVNGHQHLFYAIDPAIYTLRQARRKPLELAADVDRGLTVLLGADPGYGKLIAKNPLSTRWFGHIWHEHLWGLKELLAYIPRTILSRKRRAKEEVGLGRNCMTFEKARHFAYSEWRRLGFADYDRLFANVYSMALDFNTNFNPPMQSQEVKSIARSVSKWTARNHTAAEFVRWCSRQGVVGNLKSQKVRKLKSDERAAEAKALYASGKTQKQIAAMLGISERQIIRLIQY